MRLSGYRIQGPCLYARLLAVPLLLAVACSGPSRTRNRVPVDAQTGEVPLFALWCEPGNGIHREGEKTPGLVIAAWGDGRVVFSRDPLEGGAPYAETHLSSTEVRGILERSKAAVDHVAMDGFVIPDAGCASLFVASARGGRVISSAHELFETNGDVVATDHGIEALGGRDRAQVIQQSSAEFRAFRASWSEAVGDVRSLIDSTLPATDAEPVRYEWRDL
jgi:hypothetical protein